MHFKYINSLMRNKFVLFFYIKVLEKKYGETLLSCVFWQNVDKFSFALAQWPYLFYDSQQFPTSVFHSQSNLLRLRKESRITQVILRRSKVPDTLFGGAAIYQALNCKVNYNGLIHDWTCLDAFEPSWTWHSVTHNFCGNLKVARQPNAHMTCI